MSVRDDAVTKAVREIYDGWLRAGRSLEEAFAFATACKPILEILWYAGLSEGLREGRKEALMMATMKSGRR